MNEKVFRVLREMLMCSQQRWLSELIGAVQKATGLKWTEAKKVMLECLLNDFEYFTVKRYKVTGKPGAVEGIDSSMEEFLGFAV